MCEACWPTSTGPGGWSRRAGCPPRRSLVAALPRGRRRRRTPPRWLTRYAVDVVGWPTGRDTSCRTSRTRRPGVGYALSTGRRCSRRRRVVGAEGMGDLASISGFPRAAPCAGVDTRGQPAVVLFSGGVDEPATSSTRRSPGCSASTSSRRPTSWSAGPAVAADARRARPDRRRLPRLADAAVDPIEVERADDEGVPGLLVAAPTGGRARQRPRNRRARGRRPGVGVGAAAASLGTPLAPERLDRPPGASASPRCRCSGAAS